MIAASSLLLACAGCGYSTKSHGPGVALRIANLPNQPIRPHANVQLSVLTISGTPVSGATWSIAAADEPTGAAIGSISQSGVYSAPTTVTAPVKVEVRAEASNPQNTSANGTITVFPSVPQVAYVSASVLSPGPINLLISGANLLPQTQADLNGQALQVDYIGPSAAVISGVVSKSPAGATLTLRNPWDTVSSQPVVLSTSSLVTDPSQAGNTNGSPELFGITTLPGCSNPNTGTPTNDWGNGGDDPVYVDPSSIRVGAPIYRSNEIFWTSDETSPGQSVLMTGAFTDAEKAIRIAPVPPGVQNWQDLVAQSSTLVTPTQQGTTGLSFIVPSSFAPGVYGFEIEDPSSQPVFALANRPTIQWLAGVPSSSDPLDAMAHGMHGCAAEPGETLRIFGRNFTSSQHVVLAPPTGAVLSLNPSAEDSDSISVALPANLAPGAYMVWVGDESWDPTSSDAAAITILPKASLNPFYVTCALNGSAGFDNSANLQSCIDAAAPASGSGQLALISLPAGQFVIKHGIEVHAYELVVGASSSSTAILGVPENSAPATWFSMAPNSGLENLSIQAPANPSLVATSDTADGDPATSGNVYLSGVDVESTADLTHGKEEMVRLHGPNIQIYGSYFKSDSYLQLRIRLGDGAIVSGSTFVQNGSWVGVADTQNVIFEHNLLYSQNQPGTPAGAGALSLGRSNSWYGASAVSQNIYVGYNTFRHMGSGANQTILDDGDGGAYYGTVSSSTSNSVTLADEPSWARLGTTNPAGACITIVSGAGAGEYRIVESYSGRVINVAKPWQVLPDSTSVVVIAEYDLNQTFAHNSITDTRDISILLSSSINGLIEQNTLTNSGFGIIVAAFGPYGGPAAYAPVVNTEVLNNDIEVGSGTDIVSFVSAIGGTEAGIAIQDLPGELLSGLLVRGNTVPGIDRIFSTNGINGISANLIEQNRATWEPPLWNTPGFLVQDNQDQ